MSTFSIILKRPLVRTGLALMGLVMAGHSLSAPWMDAGDTRLRHHVQVLADATLIRVPVNTWPLMWSGVISDVSMIRGKRLTPPQRRAVQYISAAFERQTDTLSYSMDTRAAEQIDPVRGFGDTRREEQEVDVAAEYVGTNWAGRMRLGWADDPLDGRQYQWDGSYISALWGNWAFTLGSLDRWWGPGWESGLIMSNNARPVPGLTLQRNSSEPFDIGFLRWLGPWQLVLFAGQLEEDRAVENAKLLGGRFSFRPWRWLELGFSRTAQWGGNGRPQDLGSFFDVVVGNDNTGDGGIDSTNEPSNQLAGVDWRASWSNGLTTLDFYGEIIGEDESGGLPSRRIVTLGLGSTFSLWESDFHVYVEATDTASERFYSTARYGYAYEHGTYRSGYRHRGRAIGASIDNDSRAHHVGMQWYPNARNSLVVKLSELDFRANGRGTDSVTNLSSNGYAASVKYKYEQEHFYYGAGYRYYDSELQLNHVDTADDTVELSAGLRW